MKRSRSGESGFTLAEASIAAAMLVIAVTLGMAGFVHVIRAYRQAQTQDELDIEVQTAMEGVKMHTRLSSLDHMFFYPPGAGPYTAISFPGVGDTNADGVVDLDPETGRIAWHKTYVYHVWETAPQQLRLTTFEPRDNTLTDEERQAQINAVVADGTGTNTINGSNATTKVVFENLFEWVITPRGSTYDGYASSTTREINVSMGSVMLTGGVHTFKYEVTGTSSNGYKVGLDTLFVSPSYAKREAENQTTVVGGGGPATTNRYMAAGSWSGNHDLFFPATATGQYFTMTLANDRYEETNFREMGYSVDNTEVVFDHSLSPKDYVVQMKEYGTNWQAAQPTGTNGYGLGNGELRGQGFRILLRGVDMDQGGFIEYDGGKCRFNFMAGSTNGTSTGDLGIWGAYIDECANQSTADEDTIGKEKQITFGGGSATSGIARNQSKWSDYIDYAIDKDKTYSVTFCTFPEVYTNLGSAWKWTGPTNWIGCYILPGADPGACQDYNWKTKFCIPTNCIFALSKMFVTYPSNAFYTSGIFDTRMDSPEYATIDWSEETPSDTDIYLKVRSGTNDILADAADWSSISSIGTPGIIDPGDYRYIQWQAELLSGTAMTNTPQLKDVTITWPGEDATVDVGGTFTKGPDYGIVELTVDGEELTAGLTVDLEIFDEVLGYGGTRTITSALSAEIRPRNTGK